MMTYEKVKAEILAHRSNAKHFTRKFYADFVGAVKKNKYNREHNIDTSYQVNGITLFHEYDDIYNSKFYNLNSGTYCYFLEVVYGKI